MVSSSLSTNILGAESLLPQSHPPTSVFLMDDASTSNGSSRRCSRPIQCSSSFYVLAVACFLVVSCYLLRSEYPARHPLSFHRRHVNDRQIRYLALGGASTWGQGLSLDRRQIARDAYPWLLSPTTHNAATRVGGPELSALCAQSIVGNEHVYDVILIEFSQHTQGLALLAQRIRQRFPVATIIFVQLWSPSSFAYKTENQNEDQNENQNGMIVPWDDWWMNFHESISLDSAEYKSRLRERDWFYVDDVQHTTVLQQSLERVNGLLYTLPRSEDPLTALESVADLFAESNLDDLSNSPILYTLTSRGHDLVAQGIRDIVNSQNIFQRPDRNLVGTWGSGDSCHLWYETGQVKPHSHLKLRQFSKQEKYALEVPSGKKGSITMENPFDQERIVYLTYMTTSASSHPNKVYPKTKVTLNGKPSVILDPYHDDNTEHRHITRTTAIGLVGPGTTVIQLQCLEETLAGFRVVGVSLFANKEQHQVSTEFALSPEPALVGQLYRNLW